MTGKEKNKTITRFSYGRKSYRQWSSAISGAWLFYFVTILWIDSFSGHCNIFHCYLSGCHPEPTNGGGFIRIILSDKLGRRFGRRFFILIAIPCMIIYPLLWVNGMSFGIIFLLISFLKWYIL